MEVVLLVLPPQPVLLLPLSGEGVDEGVSGVAGEVGLGVVDGTGVSVGAAYRACSKFS